MRFLVVTQEWMSAHGLMPLPTMRKNKTGDKVILHEDFFMSLADKDEDGNLILDGAEVYAHNSEEFNTLLASDEWNYGETNTNTPDYIQVAAINNLMKATKASIQAMALTNEEALNVKEVYPDWKVDIVVKKGEKYNCDGDLWEVVQDHTTQENWRPSMLTLSVWKKVQVEHKGTLEDPIPFEQGMNIELGKYYIQYEVIYEAILNANAVVYDLKDIPAIVKPITL